MATEHYTDREESDGEEIRVSKKRNQSDSSDDVRQLFDHQEYNTAEAIREPVTFVAHRCNEKCVNLTCPENFIDENHRGQDPLTIPMYYGWARDKRTRERTTVKKFSRLTETSVEVFELDQTKITLLLDYFSFDSYIDLSANDQSKYGCYVEDDFSNGLETQPISVVIALTDKRPEEGQSFEFIIRRQFDEKGKVCCCYS